MAAQSDQESDGSNTLAIGVEIVDAKGLPLGELDAVDAVNGQIIENKSAAGLYTINPRTGNAIQTPADWARKQIYTKTAIRIQNIQLAHRTRPTRGGSLTVPTLEAVIKIRVLIFRVDSKILRCKQLLKPN